MKIFALFMAILVLVLSAMPCTDLNAMFKGNVHNEYNNDHRDNRHDDNCSPFCQCSCCTGFSINHSISAIEELHIKTTKPKIAFLPSQINEIALPVWQPPQLRA